jgi:hypothetical protein
VHVHQGPVGLYNGLYEVREIAEALVSISKGMTYTEAARQLRAVYWRGHTKMTRARNTVESGQTVADWLNQFGPVISAAWAENEWPECIVLDSTTFRFLNPTTGNQDQLFAVLAAWGYESDNDKGRLWRVEARPDHTNTDWQSFLEALPGRPRSVVCDADLAIISGVRLHWGRGRNAVPFQHCEHHLRERVLKALRADRLAYATTIPGMLRTAFTSPVAWNNFVVAVMNEPLALRTQAWVRQWDNKMRTQTTRRSLLPAHHSTGALDPKLQVIRQALYERKWTFRNRERMNLLLDLIRLRLNRHATERTWTVLIREHLDENGGIPVRPRRLEDPTTYNANGDRVYSLRG